MVVFQAQLWVRFAILAICGVLSTLVAQAQGSCEAGKSGLTSLLWPRTVLRSDELSDLFQKLKADARFRMKYPGAHCYHRSQLLGRYLETEYQIESQQLYLDCAGEWIFAADPTTGATHRYGDHWTNVVQVEDPKTKKTQWMVLDPQFQEQPVPLEKYVRSLTFSPVRVTESDELAHEKSAEPLCHYRRVDRRSYQELHQKIMRFNEKKEIELGLVNEFGGSNPNLSPEVRRQKEAELLKRPAWFDSRIVWNEESLAQLEQDVKRMNQEFGAASVREKKSISPMDLQKSRVAALRQYFEEMQNSIVQHRRLVVEDPTVGASREEFRKQMEQDLSRLKKLFENELKTP